MSSAERPKVVLRSEQEPGNSRHLWAYVDDAGNLHIDGQDLGSKTAIVSSDGEYEWFQTVSASDIPALLQALNADPSDDVLEVVAMYRDDRSYELEAVLRSGVVPVERFVW